MNARMLLVAGLLAIGNETVGQIDTEFWFVAPEVTSSHEDVPIRMRIASFDDAAELTLSMPANPNFAPIEVSIPPSGATTLDLTPFLADIENSPFNEVLNKGLLLESTADVSAYYEVGQTLNPDIFALKGDNALGTSFHLPFQTFANNSYGASPSGFDVVATEENTTLTITPTQDLIGHPAGIPFQVVLPQAGSTYSARATSTAAAAHPVGTVVTSDKSVAVTMHDDSANSPIFGGCADILGDQLVPDNVLGTEYIAVSGYLSQPDRLQILAIENNTTVMVDGAFVATLQAGDAHQHLLNTPSAFIESSSPVAVWQSTGFGCEFGGALLPSVKCTGSNSTVFVRSTTEVMRFNVIVPAGGEDDFLFNGNPGIVTASMFAMVPGNTDWMFAQVTTLEAQIPVGQATRIENTSTIFHMGIINGGANSGTRYGYFSDFGALKYHAVNQTLNPCIGDLLTLEVDPIENGLYQWSGPNGFEATGISLDLGITEMSDSGVYVVQGFTGECPIENDTIEVVLHLPPSVPSVPEDVVTCEGLNVNLVSNSEDVIWTGPNGFESIGSEVELMDVTLSNSGVYTATIDHPYCPAASDSVLVNIFESFAYEVVNDVLDLCVGSELVLNALPNDNGLFNWTGPNGFSASGTEVGIQEITLGDAGEYMVQGYTGECEIESATVDVSVHAPLPAPVVSEDVTICNGFTLTLGADSEDVLWNSPNGTEETGQYWAIQNVSSEDAGIYTAFALDPYCTPASADVMVEVVSEEDLEMDWEAEFEVCPGEDVLLLLPGDVQAANPSIQWSWQAEGASEFEFISNEANISVTEMGTYLAESTIETPCVVVSEGIVEVIPLACALLIPNVITPGNDDMNNRFFIENLGSFEGSSIRIYNRWGNEVYSHDNFGSTLGWLPNDDMSDGVYFYILNVNRDDEPLTINDVRGTTEFTEPGDIEIHGTITVIK